LDKQYPSEFDDLAISLYNIQKESPRLEKFRDKELLEYTKSKIIERFDRVQEQSGDALDKQKNNIVNDPTIQDYINEPSSNLTKLVNNESSKDDAYRENIKKKYDPTMGNMIKKVYRENEVSEEDQKFFDENTGKLNEDAATADKERLQSVSEKIQPLIKEKFDNAE